MPCRIPSTAENARERAWVTYAICVDHHPCSTGPLCRAGPFMALSGAAGIRPGIYAGSRGERHYLSSLQARLRAFSSGFSHFFRHRNAGEVSPRLYLAGLVGGRIASKGRSHHELPHLGLTRLSMLKMPLKTCTIITRRFSLSLCTILYAERKPTVRLAHAPSVRIRSISRLRFENRWAIIELFNTGGPCRLHTPRGSVGLLLMPLGPDCSSARSC